MQENEFSPCAKAILKKVHDDRVYNMRPVSLAQYADNEIELALAELYAEDLIELDFAEIEAGKHGELPPSVKPTPLAWLKYEHLRLWRDQG